MQDRTAKYKSSVSACCINHVVRKVCSKCLYCSIDQSHSNNKKNRVWSLVWCIMTRKMSQFCVCIMCLNYDLRQDKFDRTESTQQTQNKSCMPFQFRTHDSSPSDREIVKRSGDLENPEFQQLGNGTTETGTPL